MKIGENGNYRWLASSISIGTMLARCPEIVLKRFVAVTAFDSGPFIPTQDEKTLGWREDDGVAWSPEIYSTEQLHYESYDEWYIFRSPVSFKPAERLVNWGIELRDPAYLLEDMDPTWDRVATLATIEYLHERQEQFWSQIILIQPESYLCNNCAGLHFVTRNPELFSRAVALLGD